jgi:predicted nucleotidyltransferase
MKKTAGIIAEFNPFHKGHAALIRAAREEGADSVVAVMSGNFVQRGSPAVTDKRVRAQAALLCGVDLVLELPLVCAMAPAQRFARGAAEVLAATGVVNTLAFGSECGEAEPLRELAVLLESPDLAHRIQPHLAEGKTFAKARELAAGELNPALAPLLATPNNVLAVEYLRAAKELGWDPALFTIPRQGAAHDGAPIGEYASASYLRSCEELAQLAPYVPSRAMAAYHLAAATGKYPSKPEALDIAILAHLRRLTPDDLARLPDLSEGLENRLYNAIRTAPSLPGLLTALKTKRYTMARLRRLVLAAFLGLTVSDAATPVPYIRVLGATEAGKDLLSAMKRTCRLPTSHSLARLRDLGGTAERFAALEDAATNLFALTLPEPMGCGSEYGGKQFFCE